MPVLTNEKQALSASSRTTAPQKTQNSGKKATQSGSGRAKTIWIDLENSPHVPFFKPIIEALENHGHKVILTARDCFQVCDLADLFHMKYRRMGRHFGKNTLAKAAGLGLRVAQMSPIALFERPALSLSHGSRSHVIVSSLFRVPSMIIFDYEHSSWIRGFKPTYVMAPEVIAREAICSKGIPDERLMQYKGIKEDVYAPSFKPTPGLGQQLGIQDSDLVVTIRPPATEAHYHNPEAEALLTSVFELLGSYSDVKIVVVPRTPKQGTDLHAQFPAMFERKQVIIPDHVVDGLDLIWCSDLVISGGGTMNREAAALGVPVYSIFRGTIGAVDRYLAAQGRLVLLESVADVKSKIRVVRRPRVDRPEHIDSPALETIVAHVLSVLDSQDAK